VKQSQQDDAASGKPDEKQRKKQTIPHLINLNEDPMLSRVICHFLEQGSINTVNSETNKLAFYRCSTKMSVFNACVREGSKVPEKAMHGAANAMQAFFHTLPFGQAEASIY